MADNNPTKSPESITWELDFAVKSNLLEMVYIERNIYPRFVRGVRPRSRPRNRRDDYGQLQENIYPLSPVLVGPGSSTVNGSMVTLNHAGYEVCQKIAVPIDGYVTPSEKFGDKENLKITAKVRSSGSCDRPLLHRFDFIGNTPVYEAGNVNENPAVLDSPLYDLPEAFLNPILYIEQPNGGFILFAELQYDKKCRMLFSVMQHIPDQREPSNTGTFFRDGQLVVFSTEYEDTGNIRRLEVKQDGDFTSPLINLEFRARGIYQGGLRIAHPMFPFIAEKKSRIGIGYWPRTDQEALYFHGDIESVVCDPHGLCPCAG